MKEFPSKFDLPKQTEAAVALKKMEEKTDPKFAILSQYVGVDGAPTEKATSLALNPDRDTRPQSHVVGKRLSVGTRRVVKSPDLARITPAMQSGARINVFQEERHEAGVVFFKKKKG